MRCRTGLLCVGYMMFRSFVELCPRLFAEVTVEEALEAAAMASLVLSHLVNRVMDSIETELLCERCELFLASASAVLCIDTHREILLRAVRQDLAKELSEADRNRYNESAARELTGV